MRDFNSDKIKVKFFIPGRIRLVINLLYKNKLLATKILFAIKSKANINSIHIDSNTSNCIIMYNYEKISEFDLRRLIEMELKPFLKADFKELMPIEKSENNDESIYENEKSIAKRLLLGSMFAVGTISIASFNVPTILSTMILASPFILFYIKNRGYRLTSNLLSKRNIYLQSDSFSKVISEVDEIYMQDDVILDRDIVNKNINYLKDNKFSMERLVIYGEIDEPIFSDVKILVKNLRNVGVNRIFILSKQANKFTNYAKGVLGINSLTLKEGYMTKYINSFSEEPLIIILGKSNLNNKKNDKLVIYLYSDNDEVKYKEKNSFSLLKKDILELPYSILICKYMETTINTTENISLTINVIGLMFAVSQYIFISGAISIYFLNFVISTILLNMGLKRNDLTVINALK